MNQPYSSITMQNLQFFMTVAETGNMRASAELMHVTQPLLSQRVAQMESELELRLFIRTKQGLRLTAAGQAFYDRCQKILPALEDAVRHAQSVHQNRLNHINIGVYNAMSDSLEDEMVEEITAQFPDHHFNFHSVLLENCRGWLQGEQADLLIAPNYGQLVDGKDLAVTNITALPLCATMSARHPLAGQQTLSWQDLQQTEILMPRNLTGSEYEQFILEECRKSGYSPSMVYCDNPDTMRMKMRMLEGITLSVTETQNNTAKVTHRHLVGTAVPMVVALNKTTASEQLPQFIERLCPLLADIMEDASAYHDSI